MPVTGKDRQVLRELARRVAEIAALPVMEERRQLWKQHNALRLARPMILIFPEGSWQELIPAASLSCEDEEARGIEATLRRRLYYHEHFQDDTICSGEWVVGRAVSLDGWGLEPKRIPSTSERGAWHFDPVIRTAADLKRLRHPKVTVDDEKSRRRLAEAEDLFGGILQIRQAGVRYASFHLMQQYTSLRGLDQAMLDMADNPGMLHDAMAFLEEGHRGIIRQYLELNLLSLNNDDTYHSSGGVGFSDELPRPGFDPKRVRPCDLWASAEAQEMALVSPAMHEEFILQYERRLLAPFGLNGYGCCEDLTRKLEHVLTIPNIRRVSISPFADVDRCAEQIGGRCIFSWKPHPSHLVGAFDADKVRRYIRHTLDVARANGCVLEMILKDTHTCEHHPERFDQWCAIARELVTGTSS